MKYLTYRNMLRLSFWAGIGYIVTNCLAGHTGIIVSVTHFFDLLALSMFLGAFGGGGHSGSTSCASSSRNRSAYQYGDDSDDFASLNRSSLFEEIDTPQYNPATGFIMMGCIDAGGNLYGCSDHSSDHF